MDVKRRMSDRLNQFSHQDFAEKKALQFSDFLHALLEAEEYAVDLQTSAWDFALRLGEAQKMGVSPNDLQWMIRRRWICHSSRLVSTATDETPQGAADLSAGSCFTINREAMDTIIDSLRGTVVPEGAAFAVSHGGGEMRPQWDSDRHELIVGGRIVKRFRWPAANQEAILTAFEEDAWPPHLDDPLPQVASLDPKRRLSDAIKCLNRNQHEKLIRFRGDGTGEGVLWDVIAAKIP